MYNLEEILESHYKKYPGMQIQDAVKLVYQNEFAGGHFIVDEGRSLEILRDELRSIGSHEAGGGTGHGFPLFEEIGNGLCRLHLRGLKDCAVDIGTVNKFFIYTANSNTGSIRGFEEKLNVLRKCCKEGSLPFPPDELEDYLQSYKRRGYPPLSHSGKYRETYFPAYRVVSSKFRDYFEVFCRIDSLLHKKNSVIAAIDGNSGAGKSFLASLMEKIYDCNVFHMDHFFLPVRLRTRERLAETGGNVDYARFKDEVIKGLLSGREFRYHIYNCAGDTMDTTITVTPKRLNIVEGSYSMHPTLIEYYDLKVFLGIGKDVQSRRILERNGPVMHERFMSEWVPMEDRYFSEMDIPAKCDIVISDV
ncbi:MAG: uridine kinase family protein [Bacillota bacterium]